jgi:hypothetical protein
VVVDVVVDVGGMALQQQRNFCARRNSTGKAWKSLQGNYSIAL